jgi:hypothetical protein
MHGTGMKIKKIDERSMHIKLRKLSANICWQQLRIPGSEALNYQSKSNIHSKIMKANL